MKAGCVVIDTAPNDRSLGAAGAISDLVLVPCTPSGLEKSRPPFAGSRSSTRFAFVPDGVPRLILVPNRVDRRTLEGQQLVDELTAFGEYVSPAIGDRTVFVRAFSLGFAISTSAGAAAYGEISSLTDLVERFVSAAPAESAMRPRLRGFGRPRHNAALFREALASTFV